MLFLHVNLMCLRLFTYKSHYNGCNLSFPPWLVNLTTCVVGTGSAAANTNVDDNARRSSVLSFLSFFHCGYHHLNYWFTIWELQWWCAVNENLVSFMFAVFIRGQDVIGGEYENVTIRVLISRTQLCHVFFFASRDVYPWWLSKSIMIVR